MTDVAADGASETLVVLEISWAGRRGGARQEFEGSPGPLGAVVAASSEYCDVSVSDSRPFFTSQDLMEAGEYGFLRQAISSPEIAQSVT